MNFLHKAKCNQCAVESDNKVFTYGNDDPEVVIIGEAPGRREEAKGTPFIGRSGELLWKFIEATGIDKNKIATTNLLLCRPPENRTPTKKEINNCSGRLEAYLKKANPDYILTVGATAGQHMLNTGRGVKDIRGRVYWDENRSSYILPTLHPAACLRARQLARDLLNDIQKLHRCLNGWNPPKIRFEDTTIPEELQTDYTLIEDMDEAKELFEWFYHKKELLSFDLETSGFDHKNDYVLCMGIAYGKGKAVILHEKLFKNQDFLNYLNEWFDRDLNNGNPNFYAATPKLLWQNGKFDLKFMRDTLGIKNARVDRDSMLAHYLLDERKGEKSKDGREEGRGVHNLQYLAGFYLNAPEYEDEFKKYVEDSYADAPKPELHQYCAYDVDYSRRIYSDHVLKDMDEDLLNVEEKLLIPGTNMLSDIERRGMKIHKPRIRAKRKEYKKKLDKMEKQLANLAKSAGFSTSRYVDETDAKSEPDMLNPRSPKQMAYVLIDVLNLPKYHGERTTKEDALLYWENLTKGEDNKREKFINELLNYRKQHKLYSQYLKGMEKHIEDDGRVKSSMNLHGTSSGRLSCLAEYERVQIKNKGLIPIKDVEIGDYIEAPGGWKKVKRKACTGKKQVYQIKTSHGLELDVSNNHLFRTIDGKWKQTDELSENDKLCISYNEKTQVSDDEDIPWFLKTLKHAFVAGFFIAEGSVSNTKVSENETRPYTTNIAGHQREQDILEICSDIFESEFDVTGRIKNTGGKSLSLKLHSIKMGRSLNRQFNWRKSANRCIPPKIWTASDNKRRMFLRGFFEGDGSVSSGRIKVTSASLKLLKQVQRLLLMEGILTNINIHSDFKKDPNKNTSYNLNIPKTFNKLYEEKIGFYSDRKQNKIEYAKSDQFWSLDLKSIFKHPDKLLNILPPMTGKHKQWVESIRHHINKHRKNQSKTLSFNSIKKLHKWIDNNPYLKIPQFLREVIKYSYIQEDIESIEKLDKKETMYEIAVEDGIYCKHGIVMHNSSQPNLQNISRESDIRNIFCPPDGWYLVEVDLSQAELRTLAVLSQDPFLLEAYEDGGDLHDTMAEELFGPDFEYEDRQIAKTVNFGIVYDQSAKALAEALGILQDKAKRYINTFFTKASKAKKWLEKKSKEPFKDGVTPTSYFGRKMRFTLLTKHKIGNIKRTARNFPIQSAASDLHLLSGVEVWKKLRHRDDAFMVNLVHDSMLLETRKKSTAEIAQFAKDTMEKTSRKALNSSIPFKADVEVSDYGWGGLKEKQDDESWEEFLVKARKG